uniref:Ankyrin repeat protein n=1 Tax=Romanomermis culicivorax TaxID=13658 RepID=A0A915HL77_ROMCU
MPSSTPVSPRLLDYNKTTPSKSAETDTSDQEPHGATSMTAPTFVEACGQCDEEAVAYYLKNEGANRATLNARDKTGKVRIL